MKLNLGCGGDYKKGYLNVDAFDSTVADKIMSSTDLKLAANTADEILVSQLIEHLGIAGSIYSLSECFRVLKPKKQLIIETPDLQQSFERYTSGGREARKNLLPWIYGVDTPGMTHRFCYPLDLLEETLQKMSFTNIKKEYVEFDKYQPTLRVTCEKPADYQIYQIVSFFRKNLFKKKIVNLDDQLTALEQEELIEFFTVETDLFKKTNDHEHIKKILLEGAIRSPTMTSMFLKELSKQNMISKKMSENYLDTLRFLADVDFPNVLLKILKQTPDFVGEQEKLFKTICSMGTKTIEKLSQKGEKDDVIINLKKLSKEIKSREKIVFLSQKLIMLKANRLFQIGAKQFSIGRYKEATSSFTESTNLYRDQILTYWNLARLLLLKRKNQEASYHYTNALKLLDIFDYDNKMCIKTFLEQEIASHNVKNCSEPITSLNEIHS
jgi:predicted SAM-dependent methyltransferase